ncbi:MAG: hypothetical protein WCV80_03580 [Candidatus Paceibacterota bacterium]|jgi:hypothetical protein
MKPPKDDSRYTWTSHVFGKMLHYGIGEGRIRRIIRTPTRIEEGIAENTIAAMCPYGTSPEGRQLYGKPNDNKKRWFPRGGEMWVMYKLDGGKIKVITAWRYPGKSSARNPIPKDIIDEVRQLV